MTAFIYLYTHTYIYTRTNTHTQYIRDEWIIHSEYYLKNSAPWDVRSWLLKIIHHLLLYYAFYSSSPHPHLDKEQLPASIQFLIVSFKGEFPWIFIHVTDIHSTKTWLLNCSQKADRKETWTWLKQTFKNFSFRLAGNYLHYQSSFHRSGYVCGICTLTHHWPKKIHVNVWE